MDAWAPSDTIAVVSIVVSALVAVLATVSQSRQRAEDRRDAGRARSAEDLRRWRDQAVPAITATRALIRVGEVLASAGALRADVLSRGEDRAGADRVVQSAAQAADRELRMWPASERLVEELASGHPDPGARATGAELVSRTSMYALILENAVFSVPQILADDILRDVVENVRSHMSSTSQTLNAFADAIHHRLEPTD